MGTRFGRAAAGVLAGTAVMGAGDGAEALAVALVEAAAALVVPVLLWAGDGRSRVVVMTSFDARAAARFPVI